jgi:putative DNA primase/helicase
MKTLKPHYNFIEALNKKIKANPKLSRADIDKFAEGFENVTPEEIETFLKSKQVDTFALQALAQAKPKLSSIYNNIDEEFINKYTDLVVYQQGNHTSFYKYESGVYKKLEDENVKLLVDKFFREKELLEHRTSQSKIKDTIARIACLLNFDNGRRFVDDTVHAQKWYINVKNGLLDPVTRTLIPHTPTYFSTSQAPFDYLPDAKCPKFEIFIKTISQKNIGTDIMLKDMFGYTIATNGNPKHKVFYLYGAVARNGKSTVGKVESGLIGDSNVSNLSVADIASSSLSVIEPIIGKQLNFSDEGSAMYLDSSRFTSISAEGSTQISPKYKPAFSYKVRCKFLVTCNTLPKFQDSKGMENRMIIIPFTYQVPETERIDEYDKVLLQEEGSGILNWALDGADDLRKRGSFYLSEDSKNILEENKQASSSLRAFIYHTYDFVEINKDSEKLKTQDDLYEEYTSYCTKTKHLAFTFIKFSRDLKTFSEETGLIEQNTTGVSGYVGLQMKPERLSGYEQYYKN